jgi:undecaprenyl-phosphate 4-deoxy-4-formamido-L-arabinose transferase
MHDPTPAPLPDVSFIVPVYGGERTVGELTDRLLERARTEGWRAEVLLVCDRPRDGSWAVVQDLVSRHPGEVRGWLLQRNFGQHPATLLGIRMARAPMLVTLDEDLQHSPDDVPALVEASRRVNGIAYGRFAAPRHDPWRNLTSRMARTLLAWYVGPGVASHASAFRAFPARLRDAFATYRGERVAIDVLLSWSGAPFVTVDCPHAPRNEGHSGYTLRKLLVYLSDLLLGYSVLPLRLASLLGLVTVAFALIVAAWVLYIRLRYGSVVPGFAFLGLTIAVLSGTQLLALGMIGEYLGRLYFHALGKPQYVVAESRDGVRTSPDASPPGAAGG